ncbi:hypothetical protein ROZALSC1DRAFT_22234 [Rozella allomycis CSF55]|uniref:Peptidase M20 dimerisation domain-containing protein n=1 Tax=Rozella allomycis (strain CSF55) TaxID=988480 RepID=A0A4P9YJB5_ROZAC|nr:hypothetical protein ROZALSC1DRAFT_22234 [Rozella allomycis CSF55]
MHRISNKISFQIFRIQVLLKRVFNKNNKPVFVATLPGTDSNKGAIAFSCHMDVVPVGDIKKWKSGPFEAKKFENGDIVARGAQDMKSIGVMYPTYQLILLGLTKRSEF